MTIKKFLLISHCLPPSQFGQPRVIYRLLKNLSSKCYGLMSIKKYERTTALNDEESLWLDGPYFTIKAGFLWRLSYKSANGFFEHSYIILNLIAAMINRTLSVIKLVKREKYDCIIACSGDPVDIPSGYLAARFLRIPFYCYMFDDYGMQYKIIPSFYKFASFWDKHVAKMATNIIVPNELLQEDYAKRSGKVPIVVRNPLQGNVLRNDTSWPTDINVIKIVYTGAIYHVHEDSFERLVSAMDSLDVPIFLHLYTSVPSKDMRIFKNSKKVYHHEHVNEKKVIEIQRSADILFLPLAFNAPTPEVIRTALPGKFCEYLASGRPLLVHAPADSFVASYCSKYNCAVVINSPDEKALLDGIRQIINNDVLRTNIVRSAQKQALNDFNPETSQRKFLQGIGMNN